MASAADQRGEPGDGVQVGRRTHERREPGGQGVVELGEVRTARQPPHAGPDVVVAAAGAVVAEERGAQGLVGVGGRGPGTWRNRGPA